MHPPPRQFLVTKRLEFFCFHIILIVVILIYEVKISNSL